MNQTATRIVVAILVGILSIAGVVTYLVRDARIEEARNEAVRDLVTGTASTTFSDLKGNQLDLSDYTNEKLLLVTSWASWCPQCVAELTMINEAVAARAGSPIKVLAINRKESPAQATRFVETLPELTQLTFILDTDDHYFGAIEGYAMPESIVYNEQGEVLYHKRGNFTQEELDTVLDTALSALQ